MINEDYYRNHVFGSARFGSEADANLLSRGGAPIAYLGNTFICRRQEEPTLIIGGARSGKGANVGIYQPLNSSTNSFFILDMGGQYMSTTWHHNLAANRSAYAINVEAASTYPDINHPINLWGMLTPNDPNLFDNTRRITAIGLKDDAKGDNAWVGQGAKRWITRILIGLTLLEDGVTPKRFWEHINALDSDDDHFKSWSRLTHELPYDVHATLLEIYRKKHGSEKEYGAIMGKIKDDFDWLSSLNVAESVSGKEDYLSYLCDPKKKVGAYYALRGGSGKIMESLTRMVVGIAMLHCMRANSGSRPLFYLEEAATCGGADFIKQAVSESRKYMDTVLVYQSQGQIQHLFGKAGAQEINESCGMQIILGGGIRDIDSAKRYADMVGKATIEVDDPRLQAESAFRAQSLNQEAFWNNRDLFDSERRYHHEHSQSQQTRKAGRYAIDPAELMRLNKHVLVLTPGLGLPPILAHKLPRYFENPAMIGHYGPDPLFPPLDRVPVQHKLWGKTSKRFIRRSVPKHLAHLPNHSNGTIAYVKGYKTW